MLKGCVGCGEVYWSRWRNDPPYCARCRSAAVICEQCAATIRPPPDRDQLALWPSLELLPTTTTAPSVDDRYWSLRAKASQATRRKYPYC